jgi:protein involved in polysaccharide export with SLBB domain
VVFKKSIVLVAGLFAMCGGWAFARSQNNKGAAQQSDPIQQALAHGVDQIDATDAAPAPALDRRNSRYRIASEDVLDLQFQATPEFNQTVTVQPDGYITLREISDLQVEGDTLPQLRRTVQTAYEKILANPVISVDLKHMLNSRNLSEDSSLRPGDMVYVPQNAISKVKAWIPTPTMGTYETLP